MLPLRRFTKKLRSSVISLDELKWRSDKVAGVLQSLCARSIEIGEALLVYHSFTT